MTGLDISAAILDRALVLGAIVTALAMCGGSERPAGQTVRALAAMISRLRPWEPPALNEAGLKRHQAEKGL